jgi:hypothetical protein
MRYIYDNWSQELKNIYDDYPMLKVVFTGSSLLQILNARADLSRRAITYIPCKGFRFVTSSIETGQHFDKLTLESILSKSLTLITTKVKPLYYFDRYLKRSTTLL